MKKATLIHWIWNFSWLFFSFSASASDWFCVEVASQKIEKSILSCGVGEAITEADARDKALLSAQREFDRICEQSIDCSGYETIVQPLRNECTRDNSEQYKCYRAFRYDIQDISRTHSGALREWWFYYPAIYENVYFLTGRLREMRDAQTTNNRSGAGIEFLSFYFDVTAQHKLLFGVRAVAISGYRSSDDHFNYFDFDYFEKALSSIYLFNGVDRNGIYLRGDIASTMIDASRSYFDNGLKTETLQERTAGITVGGGYCVAFDGTRVLFGLNVTANAFPSGILIGSTFSIGGMF